ncbi:UNVERIFIED_CONTAM: hypothetical protein K2H54_002389 [Gekko kuhli]
MDRVIQARALSMTVVDRLIIGRRVRTSAGNYPDWLTEQGLMGIMRDIVQSWQSVLTAMVPRSVATSGPSLPLRSSGKDFVDQDAASLGVDTTNTVLSETVIETVIETVEQTVQDGKHQTLSALAPLPQRKNDRRPRKLMDSDTVCLVVDDPGRACGKHGHDSIRCPIGIVCNLCNIRGHTYLLCPKAAYNQLYPKAYQRFKASHWPPDNEETGSEAGRTDDSEVSLMTHLTTEIAGRSAGRSSGVTKEDSSQWQEVVRGKKKTQRGKVLQGVYQRSREGVSNRFEVLSRDAVETVEDQSTPESIPEPMEVLQSSEKVVRKTTQQSSSQQTEEIVAPEPRVEVSKPVEVIKPVLQTVETMGTEELDNFITRTRHSIEILKQRRLKLGDDPEDYREEPPASLDPALHTECRHLRQKQLHFRTRMTILLCERERRSELQTEQQRGMEEMEAIEEGRDGLQEASITRETDTRERTAVQQVAQVNRAEGQVVEGQVVEGQAMDTQSASVLTSSSSSGSVDQHEIPPNQDVFRQEQDQGYPPPFKLSLQLTQEDHFPSSPIPCKATLPHFQEGVDVMPSQQAQ